MFNTEPLNFGRYEIRGELGRGGMAVVYRAFDPQVQREVAIKVLPRQYLANPESRHRFEREAQMVAALEHSAIVPLYDFGEEPGGGSLFFVMRLMNGGSLNERIKQGRLSLEETVSIFNRIAPALDEAHAKGVIHRDLKPANILFDGRGEPYISDFGIAKQSTANGITVSDSGSIVGTPAYMSPEQARGERHLTSRSDIYALGAILFEMLAGSQPYDADTPIAVALKHITEPVPQMVHYRPDLPPIIQTVLDTAMAKEPEARYATAVEMAQRLAAGERGETDPAMARKMPRYKASTTLPKAKARPASPPTPANQPAPTRQTSSSSLRWIMIMGLAVGGLALVAIAAVGAFVLPGMLSSSSATPNLTSMALSTRIANTYVAGTQIAGTQSAAQQATANVASTIAASGFTTQQALLDTTSTAIALAQLGTSDANAGTALANANETATAEAILGATAQAEATNAALLGAKKIAFFKDNDVWVVNVDGSGLQQVTTDSAAKRNLRWLPDGETLTYISGLCLQSVHFLSHEVSGLGCFNSSALLEGFEVSPDGRYFAISVDRITYIGDYAPEALAPLTNFSQLRPLATCLTFSRSATQYLRWSADMTRMAIMVIGVSGGGLASDTIQLLKFECGNNNPSNYDQFPGTRFTLPKFSELRKFQGFGWDGRDLFALIDYVRNDGFGDFYIYNTSTKRMPIEVDPLNGCCYRDPSWSLDGQNIVFAWQDQKLGSVNKIDLYYVPYNSLISGGRLTPIPLPDGFFTDPQAKPWPVVSP